MKKKQKKKLAKLVIKAITALAMLIGSNCPANTSTQLITLVEITEERERNLPILCNNSITHISLKEK